MERSIERLKLVKRLLIITYGVIPIVAGADKFTNLLTDWGKYLNPALKAILPVSEPAFMAIAGVIEILAGLLVFLNPAKGAYIVSVWLVLIALSLVSSGNYLDVAVRDIAMAIGAFSLVQLSLHSENNISWKNIS
ncbi:MAG: hypothetical protein JWQ28_2958 [Pedobacter sp.]|jgi:hypothetical protein|nr:hypothetical protein [Pedobacter sp.]